MLYAQVVFGLPLDGPFDYIIPPDLISKIYHGCRVLVSFGPKRKVTGYVVGIKNQTKAKKLKNILEVLDLGLPTLDKNMLLLTKRLAEYYCCSWGEAIETAIPQILRQPKRSNIAKIELSSSNENKVKPQTLFLNDLDGSMRFDIYREQLKGILEKGKTAIILFPDIDTALSKKEFLMRHLDAPVAVLYRKGKQELEEWLKIKEGNIRIVIGSRSVIFAPLDNLGLIIIDQECDSVYKQEQVPHYHARDIALMRSSLEKANLILAANSLSLESVYLAKKRKDKITYLSRNRPIPEIKILDMNNMPFGFKKKNIFLSSYLIDSVKDTLNSAGKVLLFLNRRGFATFVYCRHCGEVLKCPRCSINLTFYYKDEMLGCRYCNFRMPPPTICQRCNSGYIKYSGLGIEKIESEISRIFAGARVKLLDNHKDLNIESADIFISTSSIIKKDRVSFSLVSVLGIDNSLNRIDFRAAEKTFLNLVGLFTLTDKKMIIQTYLPQHSCFQALKERDLSVFYRDELKQRRQLKFPPYAHIILVKLRGRNEERIKEFSNTLFNKLNTCNKNKDIKIVALNPAQPFKLRDNFCWQILIKGNSPKKINNFLKINLKDFSHSGIIVTVDVDPI